MESDNKKQINIKLNHMSKEELSLQQLILLSCLDWIIDGLQKIIDNRNAKDWKVMHTTIHTS